ncbi:hypothetical protein Lal_00027851 [Lupinus albus]|uniref:Uncharacterized protein n=1 Tax=Lupinus albus TaxID=3870 RepID=A0A6A4NUA0_LUPAL|nr:hypothetical protein Lalb_Chr21g0316991 [Lupinus albus]KAF1860002.1 hypothetical protein Lal_00027851 [Lupinus albus]
MECVEGHILHDQEGLISKRKMTIIDMNLMLKKGKLLRKSMRKLMHHHAKNLARGGYGMHEYEFSCSNSPNPVIFHVPKRKHHFTFPCIKSNEVAEDESEEVSAFEGYCEENKAIVLVPKTSENVFNIGFDFVCGEKKSSLLSPFSVRISNYSSEGSMNS